MNKTPQGRLTHSETKLQMPQAQMKKLREEYAQTYSQHRLGFNAWLLVMASIQIAKSWMLWEPLG